MNTLPTANERRYFSIGNQKDYFLSGKVGRVISHVTNGATTAERVGTSAM